MQLGTLYNILSCFGAYVTYICPLFVKLKQMLIINTGVSLRQIKVLQFLKGSDSGV